MKRLLGLLATLLLACSFFLFPPDRAPEARTAPPLQKKSSFTLFESGQVRPLALSPDGKTLFSVNTPDGRLEVFGITEDGIRHRGSISVGLEPVAVAARTDEEVWVVNHLSDSVSILNIRGESGARDPDNRHPVGRVVQTLLAGDEPGVHHDSPPGTERAVRPPAHHAGDRASGRLGV